MNYQITSDNIEVSPSMISLAKEKMKKLESKLMQIPDDLKSVRIVMNKEKDDQFLVKIHLVVNGKEYYAQEISFTLEHSVIASVADVERELLKDKIIETEENWREAREAKRFDPEISLQEEINQ